MKSKGMVLTMALLLAGCGNNFEWFPSGGFTNNSTGGSTGATAGKVMKTIPFPGGVTWISDLAFDRNNGGLWLLHGTNVAPTAIQKMDTVTGLLTGTKVNAANWPPTIVDGSTLAFDDTNFWITSNASSGGKPVSQIYQIAATNGQFLATYPCPATNTGFCQGLAWEPDTHSFWTTGSDTTNLVNYEVANGAISSSKVYNGLWQTTGVSDVAFDRASGQVFVVKGGVIPVKAGVLVGTKTFTLPGSGRGDWDGSLLWVVDNTNKVINGLFVR